MQFRKKEVEDILLAIGEKEFYEYGFEGASMRRILKDANVSIGNFYNYFDSKEALFNAIVGAEYQRFLNLISKHQEEGNAAVSLEELNSKELLRKLPDLIDVLIPEFTPRFVILLEGSKGTSYEGARTKLLDMARIHLDEHLIEGGINLAQELTTLLASQFIDGMVRIIKVNKDNASSRHKQISDYILFFFAGMMGLINFGK